MNAPNDIIDDLRLLEPWNPRLYAAIAAGIVLLAALFFLIRRRSSKGAPLVASDVSISEDAMAELEKIRSLMRSGNSLEYGRAVSGIVRRYIERRFGLVAPRRSTEEFLAEAASSCLLDSGYQGLLAEFLSHCDLMKFGRGQAELAEMQAIHDSATRFVGDTVAPAAQKEGAR